MMNATEVMDLMNSIEACLEDPKFPRDVVCRKVKTLIAETTKLIFMEQKRIIADMGNVAEPIPMKNKTASYKSYAEGVRETAELFLNKFDS